MIAHPEGERIFFTFVQPPDILAATSLLIDFQKRISETFPRQLLDSEPDGFGKSTIEEAPEHA
jgi:hypothetical protein